MESLKLFCRRTRSERKNIVLKTGFIITINKISYWDNQLTVNDIDVEATVKKVRELLAQEQAISPALRSTLEVLLLVVQLLVNRLGLNSRNSSKTLT